MSGSAAEEPRGATVLYLSYDGMTDPLGGSQVLPYLVGLSKLGHRITLQILAQQETGALEALRRKYFGNER